MGSLRFIMLPLKGKNHKTTVLEWTACGAQSVLTAHFALTQSARPGPHFAIGCSLESDVR